MSHWGWFVPPQQLESRPERLPVRGRRGRVLCALGLHHWHVGRYITYCLRCYREAQ